MGLEVKTLAVKALASIASSIDKIVFGQKYQINKWPVLTKASVCIGPMGRG
jgi:hypothetical protein